VTNGNGSHPEADEIPGEHKTINQIVAWNIAWFRKAAGLTQEELGRRVGRSKRNISADERSWDGGHTREFNAHEIVNYAVALGVPIGAFFLPPEDDGRDVRYLFHPHEQGADCMGMADLMAAGLSDSEDDSEAMSAYRRRFLNASARYLDEGWQDEIASWLRPLKGPEALEEGAYRLRGQREQLLASATWLGEMADALEKAREKEGE